MPNENSLFSDKQAQKHTEILKKPLLCMRLRIIATQNDQKNVKDAPLKTEEARN